MSSILDALEKAKRERGQGNRGASRKSVSETATEPGAASSEDASGAPNAQIAATVSPNFNHAMGAAPVVPQASQPRSLLVLLALLFIAALVLAGAIGYLAVSLSKNKHDNINQMTPEKLANPTPNVPPSLPGNPGVGPPPENNSPISAPHSQIATPASETPPVAVPTLAPSPVEAINQGESREPIDNTPPSPEEKKEPKTINMHAEDFLGFRIGGVLHNDGITTVLINGREHDLGETVGGYHIKSIDHRVIVLVKEHLTFRIRY